MIFHWSSTYWYLGNLGWYLLHTFKYTKRCNFKLASKLLLMHKCNYGETFFINVLQCLIFFANVTMCEQKDGKPNLLGLNINTLRTTNAHKIWLYSFSAFSFSILDKKTIRISISKYEISNQGINIRVSQTIVLSSQTKKFMFTTTFSHYLG